MPESTDSAPAERKHSRKREAVWGVVLFVLTRLVRALFYALLCLIPIPRWMFWLFTVLAIFNILRAAAALAALRPRFREIEKGEIEDASQY